MKNKSLPVMLFVLSASVVMAQNNTHTMSDMQKAQAAKADVYIINSKNKITDTFTATFKDTTVIAKKSKQRCCLKCNKKSS